MKLGLLSSSSIQYVRLDPMDHLLPDIHLEEPEPKAAPTVGLFRDGVGQFLAPVFYRVCT